MKEVHQKEGVHESSSALLLIHREYKHPLGNYLGLMIEIFRFRRRFSL